MSEAVAPLYFIIAGEPSGDAIGAHLIRALRTRLNGRVRFAGVGGELMAAQGLKSSIAIRELAIMGVVEVLPSARRILRLVRDTVDQIRALRPVAVITIDSSGFCHRVTEKLKPDPVRPVLIHYVAPMVWAWRPYRAAAAARAADHLLTLLPFEPPLFDRVKLPATYVGHPVVESGADKGNGPAFRQRHGIAPNAKLLCVLPGSRRSEARRLLPIFKQTVHRLTQVFPDLNIVVPTAETVASMVLRHSAGWPASTIILRGAAEKFDAFAASNAALAASGTVSLELAMAGVPMVIGYKILPATAWVLKRALRVRFVTLANILMQESVVPEYLQENCRSELLSVALEKLLKDKAEGAAQVAKTRAALEMLGRDTEPPSLRAADCILHLVSSAGAPAATQPPQ